MSEKEPEREKYEATIESMRCKVCLSEPSNTLALPCAHVVSCKKCLLNLARTECPICREFMRGYVEVKSDVDLIKLKFN